MPRSKSPPSYRHHKARNCAVVTLDGKNHYLGAYGSPESLQEYARLIAESFVAPAPALTKAPPGSAPSDITVNEILLAYWQFAKGYYVEDGKPTKELACMRDALRPVRALYGHTPARDFGPLALKAVRQHMIEVMDLSRGVINSRINRIRRMTKWAVSEQLIPPSVHEGLRTVAGLRQGRSNARETQPVQAVPDEWVDPLLPWVPPQIAAMIQVQRFSGLRPCEVVIMRPCDIDMSEVVWIYEPADHKNKWRGHRKLIPIGPQAQEVIRPFLNRNSDAYLFTPAEAHQWRQERRPVRRNAGRKTPVYPSELKARERLKQLRRIPKRAKRPHYDTDSYRRAIEYGLKQARKSGLEIPHWHPHQLRHRCGTNIRKKYGVEAAQVILGHARADVTQIYAERNLDLAKRIALEVG